MMYRRARGFPASDTGTSTSLTPNVPSGPGAAEGLDEVAALATGLEDAHDPGGQGEHYEADRAAHVLPLVAGPGRAAARTS